MGENIGMAARALLNAALEDLRLVAPRDGWPNEKALLAASGADKVIEGAKVFGNVQEAVADCHAVYATTLRPRDMNKPVFTPRQAMTRIRGQAAKGERAAILFGPERTGLWSDDVAAADAIITIPLNPSFSSMNLAQAVAILSYEWFQTGDGAQLTPPPQRSPRAKQDELRAFMAYLEKTLDEVGYFHPPEKRQVMWHNMQSLFARAELTEQELRTLFGVIKQLALEKDE